MTPVGIGTCKSHRLPSESRLETHFLLHHRAASRYDASPTHRLQECLPLILGSLDARVAEAGSDVADITMVHKHERMVATTSPPYIHHWLSHQSRQVAHFVPPHTPCEPVFLSRHSTPWVAVHTRSWPHSSAAREPSPCQGSGQEIPRVLGHHQFRPQPCRAVVLIFRGPRRRHGFADGERPHLAFVE